MNDGTATPTFQVGPYLLRAATERDRALLEQWIAADPWHREHVTADFFLLRVPGEDAWALEDHTGRVVFYFKTQTSCRVHIQFAPGQTAADRTRNREALETGTAWLVAALAANHFREVVFDSRNPPLIASAKRRLGFVVAPDDLRLAIGPPRPREAQVEALQVLSQHQEEGAA